MELLQTLIDSDPVWVERIVLRHMRYLYTNHKCGAAERGIGFEFTFKEWLDVWLRSGHLPMRGNRRGKYVMARFEDKGPYAINNVEIMLFEENNREGSTGDRNPIFGKVAPPELLQKFSKAQRLRHKRNPDHARQHSDFMRKKWEDSAYRKSILAKQKAGRELKRNVF